MKLFTKDIDKKLFAQYPKGSNLEDQMVVAKIFNPYGRGTWYILNSDPEDPDYLWAIVDLMDVEMGSVSRSELENIKVPPFRLGLERDIYFDPINAKEVYDGLMKGERFEKGGEIKKGDYVIVDNPYWVASLGIEKPVRRKVSMVIDGDVFFVDGSNSQMKYVKKMEEGGEIENEQSENKQMLLNRAEGFEHHAEELEAAAKKADHIPAWVVAKAERASSDLSDITHYLDGENEQKREMEEGEEKYAEGGEIKSFDVTFYKAIKRRDGEKVEILRDREDYKGSLDQVMSKALSDFQPMDEYANIKENGKEGIVAKVKVDGSAKIFSKNYGHEVGEIKVEKIVEEKKEEEKEPKKKLFGIFKKGGGIYSSDEMYKVSVHKDGEKKEEVMVRARNEKEASEMFEDTYESKMFEKYGDDIHVDIQKAMAKGGLVAYANDDFDNKLGNFESLESAKKFAKANKYKYETITFEDEKGDNIVVSKKDSFKDVDWLFGEKMAKGGKLKVGSSVKYEGKEGKVISKKGDMYFIEVENYYPNGDTLRQVVTESEVEKMADGGDLKGSGIGEEVRGFKVGDYFYETPSEKGKNRFYKITSIDKFYIKADDYTYEVNKDTHLIPNKVRQGYGGVSSWTRGDFEYKVDTKQLSKYSKGDLDGYSYNAEGGMMEKGGVTGDVHSLTDKLLSQKIQIFIDKVKPIKYYYIDEKSNSLVVGLDGNYTQDAADKFHKEATSSMEFFDADSVDSEYNAKTKDTQYRIKLKKPVKFASGGMMAQGGKTEEKWIQKAIHPKKKGALREEAKRLGLIKGDEKLSMDVLKKLEAKGGKTAQRARLAMKLKQFAGGGEMEMGGKVKFEDKVKSVKKSLLERKKVPKRLEKDYGKTYDPKEAEDAAKRIVGAQTYRERLEARLKKTKKK